MFIAIGFPIIRITFKDEILTRQYFFNRKGPRPAISLRGVARVPGLRELSVLICRFQKCRGRIDTLSKRRSAAAYGLANSKDHGSHRLPPHSDRFSPIDQRITLRRMDAFVEIHG